MKDVIYVHYGITADEYVPHKIAMRDRRVIRSKPDKGIWASRVNAHYGWKAWCTDNDYYCKDFSKSVRFRLSQSANILKVHREDDIIPYVILNESIHFRSKYFKTDICDYIDRDKLYRDYDGIEVFFSDNYAGLHNCIFNSWDCDSLCVWNPDVVEIIKEDL